MWSEGAVLNRRDLMVYVLQGGAVVLLGGTSFPGLASQSAPDWHPQCLTVEENQALSAIGERIVPGSAAAHCNRVIDLILSLESSEVKAEFRAALKAFQTGAKDRFNGNLESIGPAQLDDLLTSATPETPLYSSFSLIKEWVADAYWSSQEGMRELGWKGRVAWSKFDGCNHTGSHSTV